MRLMPMDIVRYLHRYLTPRFGTVVLALVGFVVAPNAWAEDFTIRKANVELIDQVYYLNASIDYRFPGKVLEALHKGVPLIIRIDIEVVRSRKYIWDESVASLSQRYRLAYQPLTEQYQVVNLNSGAHQSYTSFPEAVSELGDIKELPVIDRKLLFDQEEYKVRLQAGLEIEKLPVPMQFLAYVTPDWHLNSNSYTAPFP